MIAGESSNQPTKAFNIKVFQYKIDVMERLKITNAKSFGEIINKGYIYERLVQETNYNKYSNKLSPKQLKIIDECLGGLTDDF